MCELRAVSSRLVGLVEISPHFSNAWGHGTLSLEALLAHDWQLLNDNKSINRPWLRDVSWTRAEKVGGWCSGAIWWRSMILPEREQR